MRFKFGLILVSQKKKRGYYLVGGAYFSGSEHDGGTGDHRIVLRAHSCPPSYH